ncbi:acyltransferase [Paludicola sp. MB14-C6]|uniref:acyltransferase n=1 Tax=Paludihabitans sp. MB14-C6 TaxID=3070656 RepID=UPI0027DB9966|nr:acyltransferase [Paludicola sp. MB14-C6]WMJ24409.1 acyltransferase [Paludicola sp. MB14-C6]
MIKTKQDTSKTERQLQNTQSRIAYFDGLRVLSMIGVIFMHVAAGPLRQGMGVTWHFLNVFVCFFFIAVPIFFMISGTVLLNSQNTYSVKYTLKNRMPKLVIPLLIWSVIAVLPAYLNPEALQNGFNIIGYLKSLAVIPSQNIVVHLWFMYFLIPLYLISPFLKILVDHMSDNAIRYLLLIWFLIMAMNTAVAFVPEHYRQYSEIDFLSKLNFLDGYLGYFILGFYLNRTKRIFSNKILILVGTIDLLVIIIGTFVRSKMLGEFSQAFQSTTMLYIAVLSIVIFLLFKQNYKVRKANWIISYVASLSFGVYLMHNILISTFSHFNITSYFINDTIPGVIGNSLLIVTVFIVCMIVITTLATIKPLCYIFTGVKYDVACKTCNWIFLLRKLKLIKN